MPVIPALRKLKKEDLQFEASLGYVARHHLKKKKNLKTSSMFLLIYTLCTEQHTGLEIWLVVGCLLLHVVRKALGLIPSPA
jgi:hypothetical protein